MRINSLEELLFTPHLTTTIKHVSEGIYHVSMFDRETRRGYDIHVNLDSLPETGRDSHLLKLYNHLLSAIEGLEWFPILQLNSPILVAEGVSLAINAQLSQNRDIVRLELTKESIDLLARIALGSSAVAIQRLTEYKGVKIVESDRNYIVVKRRD